MQCSIFDVIRGVWIADETLSPVFDMSSQWKQKLRSKWPPPDMRHIIVKAENKHGLRNGKKAVVPRFNTNFMKHSIAHRGSVIWNALSQRLNVTTSNFKSFFNSERQEHS